MQCLQWITIPSNDIWNIHAKTLIWAVSALKIPGISVYAGQVKDPTNGINL